MFNLFLLSKLKITCRTQLKCKKCDSLRANSLTYLLLAQNN